MKKVLAYSLLLILGLLLSQLKGITDGMLFIDGSFIPSQSILQVVTRICMAYILIEIGLDFKLDDKNMSKYAKDFGVACGAAIIPWLLCFGYFLLLCHDTITESFLMGGFAAPTSAGVMLMMLASVGLSRTWVFRRARMLAIFDDLAVIMLMVPLQMIVMGMNIRMFFVFAILASMLYLAYHYRHRFIFPLNTAVMFAFGFVVWSLVYFVEQVFYIHMGVVLPAFCLGCAFRSEKPLHLNENEEKASFWDFDHIIKGIFMLGIGLSIPRIPWYTVDWNMVMWHVILITLISNAGKLFVTLFYRREASWRERMALGIAMFPRAEVGAGILLIAISEGCHGYTVSIAGISLGLNLMLTGIFVLIVKMLITKRPQRAIVHSHHSRNINS